MNFKDSFLFKSLFVGVILAAIPLLMFNNCGQGFESMSSEQGRLQINYLGSQGKVQTHNVDYQKYDKSIVVNGDYLISESNDFNPQETYFIGSNLTQKDLNNRDFSNIKQATAKGAYMRLWQNGDVPYKVDPQFGTENIKRIKDYINNFNQLMLDNPTDQQIKIKFIHNENLQMGAFVHFKFKANQPCSANVGYTGGEASVHLNSTCINETTLHHEMMHILGFLHEHNRADRDRFIVFNSANVDENKMAQYKIWPGTDHTKKYDTESIMHYSSFANSINNKAVLTQSNGQEINTNTKLSLTDLQGLIDVYGTVDDVTDYNPMDISNYKIRSIRQEINTNAFGDPQPTDVTVVLNTYNASIDAGNTQQTAAFDAYEAAGVHYSQLYPNNSDASIGIAAQEYTIQILDSELGINVSININNPDQPFYHQTDFTTVEVEGAAPYTGPGHIVAPAIIDENIEEAVQAAQANEPSAAPTPAPAKPDTSIADATAAGNAAGAMHNPNHPDYQGPPPNQVSNQTSNANQTAQEEASGAAEQNFAPAPAPAPAPSLLAQGHGGTAAGVAHGTHDENGHLTHGGGNSANPAPDSPSLHLYEFKGTTAYLKVGNSFPTSFGSGNEPRWGNKGTEKDINVYVNDKLYKVFKKPNPGGNGTWIIAQRNSTARVPNWSYVTSGGQALIEIKGLIDGVWNIKAFKGDLNKGASNGADGQTTSKWSPTLRLSSDDRVPASMNPVPASSVLPSNFALKTLMTTHNSLVVQWDKAIQTGTKVDFFVNGQWKSGRTVNTDNFKSSSITNLSSNTTYKIKMTVHYSSGVKYSKELSAKTSGSSASTASEPTETTPNTLPSNFALKTLMTTHNSLVVQWDKAIPTGTKVDFFVNGQWKSGRTVNTDNFKSSSITNLSSNTTYKIKMTVHYSSGAKYSQELSAKTSGTSENTVSAPTETTSNILPSNFALKKLMSSNNSIIVQWDKAIPKGTKVDFFVNGQWKAGKTVNADNFKSSSILNLNANTTYKIKMTVHYSSGAKYSQELSAKTN